MRVYTVFEVAKILRVRKNFVYELIYTGRLNAVRLSERRFRVTEEALQEFMKQEEGHTRKNSVSIGPSIIGREC
jgi:excisionase family DNA binding protein